MKLWLIIHCLECHNNGLAILAIKQVKNEILSSKLLRWHSLGIIVMARQLLGKQKIDYKHSQLTVYRLILIATIMNLSYLSV